MATEIEVQTESRRFHRMPIEFHKKRMHLDLVYTTETRTEPILSIVANELNEGALKALADGARRDLLE